MSSFPQGVSSITSDSWQLLAHSIEHKQNLLDYAKQCGVPVASESWGHHTDKDLYMTYLGDKVGIISMPDRHKYRTTVLITGPDYFLLCRQYAADSGKALELIDVLVPPPLTPSIPQ